MAPRTLILALSALAAAAPLAAAGDDRAGMASAPAGTAETRYCLRLEAFTGSRVERVKCWTRDKWAAQGVDVDANWAEDGVRTIG